MMTRRLACAATALLAIVALAAPARADMADACANGELAIIRTSKITGDMAVFQEAYKAQVAWYAAHGLKDRFAMVPVMTEDKAKPDTYPAASATEAMTIHYYPGNVKPQVKKDDDWKAFVDKFRASSEIRAEHVVCLPK